MSGSSRLHGAAIGWCYFAGNVLVLVFTVVCVAQWLVDCVDSICFQRVRWEGSDACEICGEVSYEY